MTLFKLYKELCEFVRDEKIYKSSELKGVDINNRLIIVLKRYNAEEIEDELRCVSRIYFKLINSIDKDIIDYKLEIIKLLICKNKSKSEIDLNTIISVIYINHYSDNYDDEKIILDVLKSLFKSDYSKYSR